MNQERSRWPLWAVIVLHLGVVLPLAFVLPIWIDEAYSLRTTAHTIAESLRLGVTFELQAPLYFGVLSLWRTIDPSPEFARLLSILFTTATLFVAARISHRLFPNISDAFLPAIITLQPVFLYAALEIRVYALALFMSSVLVLLFVRSFLCDAKGREGLVAFALFASLALYTQYYLGFLLGALGIGLVVSGHFHEARRYLASLGLTGLIASPILLWLPRQLGGAAGATPLRLSGRESVRFVFGLIDLPVLPALQPWAEAVGSPAFTRALYWAVRLAPWAVVACVLISRRNRAAPLQVRGVALWWAVLIACAAELSAVGALLGQHLVGSIQYSFPVALPAALAVASLLALIERPGVRAVCLLALLVSNGSLALQQYRPLAKHGDSRRVAEYIMPREQPSEPIVVFTAEEALVLETYYHGINDLIPIPRPVPLDTYDLRNLAIASEEEVGGTLRLDDPQFDRLWLVTTPPEKHLSTAVGISFNQHFLRDYIDRYFDVVEEQRFHGGVVVSLMRRRQGPV